MLTELGAFASDLGAGAEGGSELLQKLHEVRTEKTHAEITDNLQLG